MGLTYEAITIIGLKIKIKNICNKISKKRGSIHKFIDGVTINENSLIASYFFENQTDFLCEKNDEIDNFSDCIGSHPNNSDYFFGTMIVGKNKYCLLKIDEYNSNGKKINNDDYIYISIYLGYQGTDYRTNNHLPYSLLQKSLDDLKKDMKEIGLWNKEEFGIYTILSC